MSKMPGKVHVLTGPGRGKTTAAFGLALRVAGHGMRACIIQLMKAGETTGEVLASRQVPNIEVWQFGSGEFVDRHKITKEDLKCARDGLALAKSKLLGGDCDLLVLDEVNVAAAWGLVDPAEILSLLKARRPEVEVVLTGRDAPKEFVDFADYVSYVQSLKHPYEEGGKARKGIEW